MYFNWFAWIIFSMIAYIILKIRGNKNSPNSINVMVNYHYHGENRVINRQLPFMPATVTTSQPL